MTCHAALERLSAYASAATPRAIRRPPGAGTNYERRHALRAYAAQALPPAPLVQTGPGGDFRRAYNPDPETALGVAQAFTIGFATAVVVAVLAVWIGHLLL